MQPILENAVLSTDLDAKNLTLLNVKALDPVPSNLAQSDDYRLTNQREPIPGSVTNESVAADAAILQSKLNLNGQIPMAWLGTAATTAAQGDLAEYLSNKNQPGGYAGLDGSGKIPAANLPAAVGAGTVTSIGLVMPAEFSVTGSPVTGSGSIAVAWAAVSDLSWFGNKEGIAGPPQFYTAALPVALIPNLDTAIVTSGVFAAARLPVAIGLGGSHAPGVVPDPGDGSGGALATDYLARDMSFKPAPTIGPSYQPTIPTPTLNASANITGAVSVAPSVPVPGAIFFYSFTSASADFTEFPDSGKVSVPILSGNQVWVYAAHAGYNNSAVATYTNSNVS